MSVVRTYTYPEELVVIFGVFFGDAFFAGERTAAKAFCPRLYHAIRRRLVLRFLDVGKNRHAFSEK